MALNMIKNVVSAVSWACSRTGAVVQAESTTTVHSMDAVAAATTQQKTSPKVSSQVVKQ
jgi:hypothetical protein